MVAQQKQSSQGMPRRVMLRGQPYDLGFYNSFSPLMPAGGLPHPVTGDVDEDGRLIALYAPQQISYQFHPESVMSRDGRALLCSAVSNILT
jgi:phenazine biosynthesis protein phzE